MGVLVADVEHTLAHLHYPLSTNLVMSQIWWSSFPMSHTEGEKKFWPLRLRSHPAHNKEARKQRGGKTVIILVQLKITIMLFNCVGKNLFKRAW